MILQKGKNVSLSFSPFQAYKTPDNKLRFSDGFIFNIFEDSKNKDGNELDVSLKESCNFCRPSNMREDFSYEKGDKFYLSIDRYDIKTSKIIKVALSESLPTSYVREKDYILICAINNSGNINQILKQNVFIQDRYFATKKAFQVNQISTEFDERTGEIISKKYKMEGGFAVCLSSGKVLFVDPIEFEVQGEESLLEKEEPEKRVYLVAEYSTEVATLDQENDGAYVPYDVIRSATLTDAYLEIQGEKRDFDSIEEEAPKTGREGNQQTDGKFYIPIYPLIQPKEGNRYLYPYVERYQILVGSEPFTGPDGEYANPVYDPIELSAKPPLYYIWISINANQSIPLTDEDIIGAIIDGAFDLTYALEKHSVLKLRV